MMHPPRFAVMLLSLAPPEYREQLIGDLCEECLGAGHGRAWFWRQTARSLPDLFLLRASRAEWLRPATAFLVAAGWLFVAWHVLWTFVLSQVPLKADPASWF